MALRQWDVLTTRKVIILSKQEGGEWTIDYISNPDYKKTILSALEEYKTGNAMSINKADAVRYAEYMLKHISEE